MRVFCKEHKAAMCYGCKDKFHNQCQVEEVADPDRISQIITHLIKLLAAIRKDQDRLNIGIHIDKCDESISEYETKIQLIQARFQECIKADKILEYSELLDLAFTINREFRNSKVYRQYCSFIFNYNIAHKIPSITGTEFNEPATKSKELEVSKEEQECEPKLCAKEKINPDISTLCQKVVEFGLEDNGIDHLILDLSTSAAIHFIDWIIDKGIKVFDLRRLEITNCDKELDRVSKLLAESIFGNIKILKISCDQSAQWEDCEINPLLPSLKSAVKSMNPIKVHLDAWRFISDDLSIFLNSLYSCEEIKITEACYHYSCSMKLDKNIQFKTKSITLKYPSIWSYDRSNHINLIEAINESKLKDSLETLYLINPHPGNLYDMNDEAYSLGLENLTIRKYLKYHNCINS